MEWQIRLGGGTKVSMELGGHEIATDQPQQGGGEDSAPAPFALFLASIGTCAGFYVQAYCANKGIDPTGIRLGLSMERNEDRSVKAFRTTIYVPESLPQNLHKTLERVAAQCAVKKAIQAAPEFIMRTVVEK